MDEIDHAKSPELIASLMDKAGELGLLGTAVPEEYGGADLGFAELVVIEPTEFARKGRQVVDDLQLLDGGDVERVADQLILDLRDADRRRDAAEDHDDDDDEAGEPSSDRAPIHDTTT